MHELKAFNINFQHKKSFGKAECSFATSFKDRRSQVKILIVRNLVKPTVMGHKKKTKQIWIRERGVVFLFLCLLLPEWMNINNIMVKDKSFDNWF